MRPRLTTLGVALVVVLVAGCSWPQWGGGPEHRGTNAVPGLTATSAPTWVSHRLLDGAATTPAVDADGSLFLVRGTRLLAVHPGSGAVLWAADLPAGTTAGGVPAVDPLAPATVFVDVASPTQSQLVGYDVAGMRNCNPVMRICDPVFRAFLGAAPATPLLTQNGRVFVHGASDLRAFDAQGTTNCLSSLGTATCAAALDRADRRDRDRYRPDRHEQRHDLRHRHRRRDADAVRVRRDHRRAPVDGRALRRGVGAAQHHR